MGESKVVTATDVAYFAGLFDGEGSINLAPVKRRQKRVSFQLTIAINMSHLPTVQRMKNIWDIGSVHPNPSYKKSTKVYKPMWRWVALSNQACYILRMSLPYLCTKKAEAELAIAFQLEKVRRTRLWPQFGTVPEIYYDREAIVAGVLKASRQANNPAISKEVETILRDGQLSLAEVVNTVRN